MSAAASGVRGLRVASCARRLAQPSWHIAGLLLIIATISACGPARASLDKRDASLQASQGRAALIRTQYLDAERLLTAALESAALPAMTRVFALSDRGVARWRLHNLRAAVDDFNAAVKLAPEEATLYNNRGNVLLELHLYAEAAKDFGQAVALTPQYGAAYNNLGNARFLLGDPTGALADFTKAIRLMPSSAVPFNGRGKAQLALRRPAGAFRDFSRAIVLSGRYGQAYANRAEALVALRRYKDAVSDYASALQFGADTAQVYLGRASAFTQLHKPDLALADFTHAVERDPSLAAAAAERRSIEDQARQHTEAAATDLARALVSDPHAPTPLPCAGRQRPAQSEPRLGLPKLADALHSGVASALVYQAKDEPGDALGAAEPAGADDRLALPCDAQGEQGPAPLAQQASAGQDGDQPVVAELDGWSVERSPGGDYVATHPQYPALRLTLEMYGAGEPVLLNWQTLKGALRGIGLLHYYAGTSPEGERLEYIAMVDTKSGKLLAIEPGRWGQRQAEWNWNDLAVVVVDPQGVPSRVQLREEDNDARPPHLRHIKQVRRYIPPQFTQRARTRLWSNSGGFNPWNFR